MSMAQGELTAVVMISGRPGVVRSAIAASRRRLAAGQRRRQARRRRTCRDTGWAVSLSACRTSRRRRASSSTRRIGKIPYRPEVRPKATDIRANRMCRRAGTALLHVGRAAPDVRAVRISDYPESRTQVVMAWDFMNAFRIIPTDGRPHIPASIKLFQGDSVGRWEGGTLVVDTTNQNDRTWLDTAGNIHSDAIHVVERFTLADAEYDPLRSDHRGPERVYGPMEGHGDLQAHRRRRITSSMSSRASRATATCSTTPSRPAGRRRRSHNPRSNRMRMRSIPWVVVTVAVAAGLLDRRRDPSQPRRPPGPARTADGKPNLNGIWQAMNEANWDIQAHTASRGARQRPGRRLRRPAWPRSGRRRRDPVSARCGRQKKKENFANRLKLDPEIKCYLPGVPRAMYMPYPFQIIQSQKHIMMVFEYAGAVRTIYMDNHQEAPADSWMGWSNGRWEGDTLVVDSTGFIDQTWFDRAGNFHSDALHVVERFTRADAGCAAV